MQLAGARDDFDGDALPSNLTSTSWPSNGDATVADGELSVDGALVAGHASAGAPRTLEFRAASGAAPLEHVGFGDTFELGPWAMFSTGGGGLPVGLYARMATGAFDGMTDYAIPGVDPTVMHTYRIEWTDGGVSFFVDGALVDAVAAIIDEPMRPLVSDYDAGGGSVAVDWMSRDGYRASGTFLSRVLDAGDPRAAWGSLAAVGDGDIAFATRSGDTPTPDASWSDFAGVRPGGEVRSPRGRYLQYRATLTTADPATTPTLNRVDVAYDIDTVAPATTVDPAQVSGARATITFASPDTDVGHFDCKLDGGAFTACTSPTQLTGLADGHHSIAVRAIDAAGNTGDAATRGFDVDTTGPDTTLPRVSVSGSRATVQFASSALDLDRFECSLDRRAYAACKSPVVFGGLAVGPHSIVVRAVDRTGNAGPTRSTLFVVAPSVAPQAPAPAPAPPADRTAPKVGLAQAKARVSSTGLVRLTVTCPRGEVRCSVVVRLQRRGGALLARKTATITGGSSNTLRLRLTSSARRKLAKARRMKVTASIAARDTAGNAATTTKPLVLLPATRR